MSDHPNFNAAVRLHGDRRLLALEQQLRCPHCPAMNRPGATIIEIETATRAVCGVCGKPFDPSTQEQKR